MSGITVYSRNVINIYCISLETAVVLYQVIECDRNEIFALSLHVILFYVHCSMFLSLCVFVLMRCLSFSCVVLVLQDCSKNPLHRLFGSREQQRAGCLWEPHVQHQHKVSGRQSCPIWPKFKHSLHNGIIRSAWREGHLWIFLYG